MGKRYYKLHFEMKPTSDDQQLEIIQPARIFCNMAVDRVCPMGGFEVKSIIPLWKECEKATSIAINIAPLPEPFEDKYNDILYCGEDCADIDSSILLYYQKERIRQPGVFRFIGIDEATAGALPEWNDLKLVRDTPREGYGEVIERCSWTSCDQHGMDSPSRTPNIKFAKLVLGDDVH